MHHLPGMVLGVGLLHSVISIETPKNIGGVVRLLCSPESNCLCWIMIVIVMLKNLMIYRE